MRVKCLAQEHNTMSTTRARTRTARSAAEHTSRVDNLQTNEMKNVKCNNIGKKVYRIEDVLNHFQTEFGLHAEWHVIKQSALLDASKIKSKQLSVVVSL